MHMVAVVVVLFCVLLVYIYGGEVIEGVIDDVFRYVIIKYSYLYFVMIKEYVVCIVQFGEELQCVIVFGVLSFDGLW